MFNILCLGLMSIFLTGCFNKPSELDLLIQTMNHDELLNSANKSYDSAHNNGALKLYEEFAKRYPNDSQRQVVMFKIALLHYAMQDYHKAADAFAKFIGIDSAHPLAAQAQDYIKDCNQKCDIKSANAKTDELTDSNLAN